MVAWILGVAKNSGWKDASETPLLNIQSSFKHHCHRKTNNIIRYIYYKTLQRPKTEDRKSMETDKNFYYKCYFIKKKKMLSPNILPVLGSQNYKPQFTRTGPKYYIGTDPSSSGPYKSEYPKLFLLKLIPFIKQNSGVEARFPVPPFDYGTNTVHFLFTLIRSSKIMIQNRDQCKRGFLRTTSYKPLR